MFAVLLVAVGVLPLVVCPYTYDAFALPKAGVLSLLLLVAVLALGLSRDISACWPATALRQIGMPLGAFVLVSTGATFLSFAPRKALIGDYQRYQGLLALFAYASLALLAPGVAPSPRKQRLLLLGLVLPSLPVSIYAIAQHLGFDPLPWDLSSGREALRYRAFSTMSSPSFLGPYLALVLPVAIAMLFGAGRPLTVLLALALGAGAGALLFTYCRAAWLGAGAGVILVGVLAGRRTWQVRFPVMAAALVALAFVSLGVGRGPSLLGRAVSLARPAQGSAAVRLDLWRAAVSMLRARPLLGWGPASFRSLLPAFAPHAMTEEQRANLSAHNLFLDVGVQSGLLGLAVFLWLLIAVLRAAHKGLRSSADEPARRIIFAGSALLAAYLVTHQFGFPASPVEATFWICLGLVGSSGASWAVAPASIGWRRAAILLAALVVALLAFEIGKVVAADLSFRRGVMAASRGDEAQANASLLRAAHLAPIECYSVRYARLAEEQSPPQWETAERYYRRALAIDPRYGPNHYNLARLCLARGGPGAADTALAHARVAAAHDPYDADSQLVLGLASEQAGLPGNAIKAYQRTLQLRPDEAMAHNNLANLYAAGEATAAEAEHHYQRALALAPECATYHYNLGVFYLRRGKPDLARSHLRRALSLEPGNPGYARALRGVANPGPAVRALGSARPRAE